MAFFFRTKSRVRLIQLSALAAQQENGDFGIEEAKIRAAARHELTELNDRLGRSGFLTQTSRRSAAWLRLAFLAAPAGALAGLLAVKVKAPGMLLGGCAGGFIGLYVGFTAWLFFLRYRNRDFEREVLFRLPLFLESLILVVESGIGVLPALENVISRRERLSASDPVSRVFGIVYRLASNGLPLEQALELVASHCNVRVLRHVLLHLDISANVGGELIPSLRSLSDHAHVEWRLSVEERVRRLENLVVFPVFASVIGLILLTAAVPLVPLLKLQGTLESRQELRFQPSALRTN